jgi:pantetheine-phosphate adenylyltransferase
MSEKIAMFAGSFDPITKGHEYLIRKALTMFDKVIVAVAINPGKKYLFTESERQYMIQKLFDGEPRLGVVQSGMHLIGNVAAQHGVQFLIRGMRNTVDFEEEKQLQNLNLTYFPNLTTVFLVPPKNLSDVSSSLVKGVLGFSGWQDMVQDFLPSSSYEMLIEKFGGE